MKKKRATLPASVRNAMNRAEGDAFENRVIAGCVIYEARSIAKIEKTPEPVKQLTKMDSRGRFTACYEKRAQPDFKGTLKGGRCIVFDAKSTEKTQIEYRVVKKHQVMALDEHSRLGASCLVVVGFQHRGSYAVPWDVWKNMKRIFGRLYLTEADIQAFKVEEKDEAVLFLNRVEQPLRKAKEE